MGKFILHFGDFAFVFVQFLAIYKIYRFIVGNLFCKT